MKDTFRSPKTLAAEARLNKVASKLSKAKPTGVTKAKPTGVTKAKVATSPVATKGKKSGLNKREKAGLAVAGATAAGFIGTGLAKRKKPASKAAKVTFGEAFKAARKKGEGTKFTWNGKSYTAVTKDDLKKKGYDANELRQYANRKGKARGPLRRAGQGIKKVLLGKDKKFGGDKGAIDFIRRPKKKAGGGMATGVSRSRVTPGQKSATFRGRPDMPNVMPDRTRGGVLDTAELAGKRKPGMKKGGIAAKKMRYGGETRPMGSDPKPMIPERPRPMPQESRVRVRPGMKAGGAVKKYKAGGLAKRGLGKAYMKSKR